MPAHRKNPWVAAVLNFFLYGPGYIYNGRRVAFGIGLLVVGLLEAAYLMLIDGMTLGVTLFGLLFGLLFAYDGYREAQEMNKHAKKQPLRP